MSQIQSGQELTLTELFENSECCGEPLEWKIHPDPDGSSYTAQCYHCETRYNAYTQTVKIQ
jgi:hypothetical protein